MRLVDLRLIAYGPFTDHILDFGQGSDGLHIIYGPNEAGKSVALRAIRGLLYGIPPRSTDHFLHDRQQLRIGARLRRGDGNEAVFIRRKGSKNTLLDADGNPLDENSIRRFLGGATSEIFTQLHGIDHQTLLQGGEEMRNLKGQIGESLFVAGIGKGIQQVLSDISEEWKGIYVSRSRKGLAAQLAAYRTLQSDIREHSLSGAHWQDLHDEYGQVEKTLLAVHADLQKVGRERNHVERMLRFLPRVAKREEILSKRDLLGKVRVLPETYSIADRREAMGRMQHIQRTRAEVVERLQGEDGVVSRIKKVQVPTAVLAHEKSIQSLQQQAASVGKALEDRKKLVASKVQLESERDDLLRELPGNGTSEQAEPFHLSIDQKARIRELADLHRSLTDRPLDLQRELVEIANNLRDARQRKMQLPMVHDWQNLQAVLARVQRHGDMEAQQRSLLDKVALLKSQMEQSLQNLGLWTGTIGQLAEARMVSPAILDRFEGDFARHEEEIRLGRNRIDEGKHRLAEVEADIHSFTMTGSVPSEEELLTARRRRDQQWIDFQDTCFSIKPIPAEGPEKSQWQEIFRNEGENYQARIRLTDDLADRLRREADRIARLARLQADRQVVGQSIARQSADMEEAANNLARLRSEWQALWRDAGIKEVLPPREMREWLAVRQQLLADNLRLQELQDEQCVLLQTIADCIASLRSALQGMDEAQDFSTLAELIEHANLMIDSQRQLEKQHLAIDSEVSRLDLLQGNKTRLHKEAEDALGRWRQDWGASLGAIGLHRDATPGQANAVLDLVDKLVILHRQIDSLQGRISAIDQDENQFIQALGELVNAVCPDLVDRSPLQAAEQLFAQLHEAKLDMTRLRGLKEEQSRLQQSLHDVDVSLSETQDMLDGCCRLAGCSRYEELSQIENISEEYRKLNRVLQDIDDQLLAEGDGQSLEEILSRVRKADADALRASLETLGQRGEDLANRRSAMDQRLGELRTIMQGFEGGGRAAELAEQASGVLAEIGNSVRRYIHLRLAGAVLRREIEEHRRKTQGPLIQRGSELFQRLTGGSFQGLTVDYDEGDSPVLVGLRPSGSKDTVANMSDGTRDQLYLALRIAYLERESERQGGEPMPFVIDDILINFDDRRSRATLEVLAELADRMQVIYFTHHEHLLDLAREVIPAGLFSQHSLVGRQG